VFVARFIGSPPMNVLAGRIRWEDEARWSVDVGGGTLPLDGRWTGLSDGRPVQVGIRPEHLRPAGVGMPVEVTGVEWLGHEQILQADCGDDSISVRDVGERELASPGSAMHLSTDAAHVHLFDDDSGERLLEVEVDG
jgi:multiple sugar transport system ATP-binding protein